MCTGKPFTPRSRRSQFDKNSEPSFSCKWNKSYQDKILLKEIHFNGHHRIFYKLANSKVRTTIMILDPIINSGSETSLFDQSGGVRVFAVTKEPSKCNVAASKSIVF